MSRVHSTILLLAIAGLTADVETSVAADGCCAQCGHNGNCQKVCRLVCEEKKVDVVCWGCKSEDFCLSGPNQRGCRHYEQVCTDQNDSKAPECAQSKDFVWTEWLPCTATMFTKKKLMKKVVTKKIPSFKWVVEDLCQNCEVKSVGAEIPPGSEIPAPPVPDAKLKYRNAVSPVPEVQFR